MTDETWAEAPRKLSHAEGRLEQLVYWSGKSVAERLAGAEALTGRMYRMRGVDLDELKADWAVRRVPRRRG